MPKKYAFLLGVFIVAYMILTFGVPSDADWLERLGLSDLQFRLIRLTLALPLVMIWFLAFYGSATFKAYALKIIGSPDGRAFNVLANGLMVLALALPVSSITSATLRYLSRMHPEFTAAAVITNRYISLGLAIIAFVLIHRGAKSLVALTAKKSAGSTYVWSVIAALTIGGPYTYLIITNSANSIPDPSIALAIYYLPAWLVVATIVTPYVWVWYLGIKSAVFILFYKKHIQGLVYRQALGRLAAGIGIVVGGSIVVQLLTPLSSQLVNWGLGSLLTLVYLLVVIVAIGYVLIALGAKRLKKIEDV